jgi:hypothetical protein
MSDQYQNLVKSAHEAGMAALEAACPTPMIVTGGVPGEPPKTWYVEEGACGFAWVEFAGSTSFGRWAKKTGLASKAYPKGLMIWVSEGGQSIDRKEAYASAFAKVLNEAGIKAYANSRLD